VLGGGAGGRIQAENHFACTILVTVLGEIPDKKKALKEIFTINFIKPPVHWAKSA
jgi:hypothetical protein